VLARRVEEEAIEEAFLGRRRRSTVVTVGTDGVARRQSRLYRDSSLARRFSVTSSPGNVSRSDGTDNDFVPTFTPEAAVAEDGAVLRRASIVALQRRGSLLGRFGPAELDAVAPNASPGQRHPLPLHPRSHDDAVAAPRVPHSGGTSTVPAAAPPPPPSRPEDSPEHAAGSRPAARSARVLAMTKSRLRIASPEE
jgi:hypothetical protein